MYNQSQAYKYTPFGPLATVMPYLIRRAQENSTLLGGAQAELQLVQVLGEDCCLHVGNAVFQKSACGCTEGGAAAADWGSTGWMTVDDVQCERLTMWTPR